MSSGESEAGMSDDDIRDAVREAGLDWHRGFACDDETNRYAVLCRAVERAARAAEREAMYKSRGTLLFNPYSGRPRHPSDIESDPHGILLVDPERPLDGFSIEVKHG